MTPPAGGNQPGVSTPPENQPTQTPAVTPKKTPKVTKKPTPTPVATVAPPPPAEQTPTAYAPLDMSELTKPSDAGDDAVLTYDADSNTVTAQKIPQFGVPLGYKVKNGHAVWVRITGEITGESGFRCWLQDEEVAKDRCSEVWEELKEPDLTAGRTFDKTFQLVSESDTATHLWFKGPDWQTAIDGIKITSIEISYPLGESGENPGPGPGPGGEEPVAPTVAMKLAKHAITAESATTAEVSVSAGEVKEVTWSVGDTTIATAVKDEADAKKAAITGVAPGKTKVTAEVKVTVDGKDFTVKAEKDLTVAEKGALVVNASIDTSPAEVIAGQTADLEAAADTGTVESAEWKVEGDAATIAADAKDPMRAVLTAVKPGEVTVSLTVTVKSGDKTATDTVKKTIKVIKDPSDIIEIDITKDITVAGWGNKAAYEVQSDGSVKCTWAADADNYTFVKFSFDGMDLTNYYCVIDAEGSNMNVDIQDAVRIEPDWGNPYAVVAPQYGNAFPFQIQLTEANYNPVKDKEGNAPDYTNVGGVNIYKGTQSEEFVLIVKSIKFYKYEEDIPK